FAIFKVKDQGYGMDESQQEGLFQKYKRADEHRVGGTGLGLYVVKLIVDAHSGTIELESKKGIGSSFLIKLPLNLSSN
ncbi:MAG TPA: ATP-binding protein, partial [Trueperaceae bacterium]|nr:ATP-binding protein [Trueperaceae bacterium]